MRKNLKQKALRRLAIAEGQVKGIRKMVEREKYCVDVIAQIEAARQALSGAGDIMLRNHLLTHIAEQMASGKKEKAMEEIIKIYRLARK